MPNLDFPQYFDTVVKW